MLVKEIIFTTKKTNRVNRPIKILLNSKGNTIKKTKKFILSFLNDVLSHAIPSINEDNDFETCIRFFNKENEWLFSIEYNNLGKKYFLYSYNNIYLKLFAEYEYKETTLNKIVLGFMSDKLNITDLRPFTTNSYKLG